MGGDVAWSLTFADPNTPGDILAHTVASAPDGGACTLSAETLDGAASAVVVARYDADGGHLWEHAVSAWPADQVGFDVTAVDDACVAVGVVASSRVGVARVDEGGVSWTQSISTPGSYPNRVFVRPDGTGGVWIGTGESGRPPSPAFLSRIDASGAEVLHIVRDPSGASTGSSVSGIRALAVLPDGRAVAASDADLLLIADRDGEITSVPRDPDFTPTALALDTVATEAAAFVMGVTSAGAVEVRRIDVDGTTTWATPIAGAGSSPPSYVRPVPYNLTTRDGDLFAVWEGQLARLRRDDGVVRWSIPLPDETHGASFYGVVADDDGVVVGARLQGEATGWWAAFTPNGTLRWSETAPSGGWPHSSLPRRLLIPCANGGTCVFDTATAGGVATASLTARDPNGATPWSADRRGRPAPSHTLYDAVLAPDGGLYVVGATVTDEGGRDLLVGRVSPEGALAWSVAVDGGGTSEGFQAWLGTTPEGGVIAATGGAGTGLVARLHGDGTPEWVRVLDGGAESLALLSVAVGAGGESYMIHENGYVVDDQLRSYRTLTSLAADGSTAWSRPFPDDLYVYPWSAMRAPTGVALATEVLRQESALQVEWLDATGASLKTSEARTLGGCSVDIHGIEAAADIDTSGVVHFAGYLGEGPASCTGPAVFRLSPDGMVAGTFLRPDSVDDIVGLGARPDGAVAVAYRTDSYAYVLARVDADGQLEWATDLAGSGLRPDVVAPGVDDDALIAGHTTEPASPGYLPLAASYAPNAGLVTTDLPPLPTYWSEAQRVVADDTGGAYVLLTGSSFGTYVSSVVRIENALSVPLTTEPDAVRRPPGAGGPQPGDGRRRAPPHRP